MSPPQASHAGAADAPVRGRRSVWPVVIAALCLSLPLHLSLALWLSGIAVERPERTQPALLVEGAQGLAEVPPGVALNAPVEAAASPPMDAPPPTAPEAAWQAPAVASGAVRTPEGGVPGELVQEPMAAAAPSAAAVRGAQGTGGLGSTTFFGTSASGRRFAFIVDKSGSMASEGKMQRAADELLRSVRALPDFTQFRVCLFDTGTRTFPEAGWSRARPVQVDRLATWLGRVGPQGGTTPVVAFQGMVADGAPDAIFFLTDGEIAPADPAAIVQAVSRPTGVVPVHCVAFGDPKAAAQLEGIAKATGGDFRFVRLGGAP